MILVAACPEAAGSEDMQAWLELGSADAIRERLDEEGETGAVYAQTALLLLEKMKRARVLILSEMSDERVRSLGAESIASLEEGIRRADEILGGEERGYVIPQGGEVLPRFVPGGASPPGHPGN